MALAQPARAAIARIDRDQPVTRVRTMDDVAAESVLRPRFHAGLADRHFTGRGDFQQARRTETRDQRI
jgi:hypothetical protein